LIARSRLSGVLLLNLALALVAAHLPAGSARAAGDEPVFPGEHWALRTPEQLGLSRERLDALRDVVGGRGCVVRHGYFAYAWGDQHKSSDVASAMKPLISTLMLMAVQDGKIAGVDDAVGRFEPRLKTLNGGKDAAITWRHLASQTSGYGLAERPGVAWAYNDFALALYYDTLMDKVYRQPGTAVLKERIAAPLRFEDPVTFEAFGPDDRKGRLAISARDFARFGLLWLRGGRWGEKRLLDESLVKLALSSPVPPDLARTGGREAAMLPGQRSIGGTRDITPIGPGYYTFNWWSNSRDRQGRRLFFDAPTDAYAAIGHGGPHALWVVPGLDLVVSWNDSTIDDHDASPGNPRTRCSRAARLMREAVVDGN
jgi:CubicO group peptidase (beta-lactamase class C family)